MYEGKDSDKCSPRNTNLGEQRMYGNSFQFLDDGVQGIHRNIMQFTSRVTLSLIFFNPGNRYSNIHCTMLLQGLTE